MVMTKRLYKKSIKKAIQMYCRLGGYGIEQALGIRRHSQHRLIYSGIDLLDLQDAILKLTERELEAVSQFGYNEPYNRADLDLAIASLSNTIGL